MLPETRKKRGAINAIGSAMKILFGTMDNDDLETFSSKISELEKIQSDILHNNKEMLTYFKSVIKDFKENAKVITVLGENVKNVLQQISNVNISLWSEIEGVNKTLQYHMKISSLIREVELYLNSAEYELSKLMKGLDVTSNGRLSSLLIPPDKLSKILSSVSQELTHDLSLIASTKLEEMYIYYELADVHAISQTKYIQLIIEIPLKTENRLLDLYSVKSLPYREPSINKFIYVKSNTEYLALTKTRQEYVELTHKDVIACRGSKYSVCPANIPLYSYHNDSCIYALFVGETSSARVQCEKKVIQNFSRPILHQMPNKDAWIYSAPEPIRVTWRCDQDTKTEILKERGVLLNPHHCHIYSKYFTLLPHTYGRSIYNLTKPIMIEPPISSLISPFEAKILTNNVTHMKISDVTELNIDEVLHGIHNDFDDVSLNRLINDIQEIQREKQQSRNEQSIRYAGGFTVIIIGAALLLYLVYRTKSVSKCLTSTLIPATTSSAEATQEAAEEVPEVTSPDGMNVTAVYVKPGVRVAHSQL